MTRRLIVAAVGLSLFLAPFAIAGGSATDGAATYKAKCAMCHGADGAGQTPMGKNMKLRDLRAADVQKQTDAELVKWIADGKGKMPAYKAKLGAADIDALVAFIRSIKK
jgi:cytochrome c6